MFCIIESKHKSVIVLGRDEVNQKIQRPSPSSLRYTNGKRRGAIVRRDYEHWRQEQTPPIPNRCDVEGCKYYSEPLVWNGKSLKLILDHRNGNNTDDRPENLRFLCPNCDSQQTDTRGGANKGRIEKSDGGFAVVRNSGFRDYVLPAESGVYSLSFQNSVGSEPCSGEVDLNSRKRRSKSIRKHR
jgi:hypothetical protein